MFKLDLEKAEEPEIKLPISGGSQKKQENSRKISTSASLTTLKPLTVQKTNWKILKQMGLPDHLTCLLRNLYAGQEATVRVLFLPPSDAYVRSLLYLLYTLIKLYYTKNSEQSSLISGSRLNSSPLEAKNSSVFSRFNNNLSKSPLNTHWKD